MKRLIVALAAVAAFTGSALAADMAPRYSKAPMAMPVAPNWTGFYIFGGGGGGLWDSSGHVVTNGVPVTIDARTGGDGYFGTVGVGYDWQFNSSWVFGLLADGQFGSIRGTIQDQNFGNIQGTIKMQDAWAAGARLGYIVAPNVLSYVNVGYSGSHWSRTTLLNTFSGFASGLHTDSFNRNGVFFGGGVENSLNIFGIGAPGWFMKTEYRGAWYDRKTVNERFDGTNVLAADSMTFKPFVQTISTSLVYRFNWTGPLVAKY